MKKSTSSRRKAETPRKSSAPVKARKSKTAVTSGNARRADPNFSREQLKYEAPVPSRELILDTLIAQGVPVSDTALQKLLHVTASEQEGFERRLSAMQREGQIMRNRREAICIVEKLDLVAGQVQGHKDGYGFLIRDDKGPDVFLGSDEMRKVLHGDRVMVRIAGVDRRGRPEGKIAEVLERTRTRHVGRLNSRHGVWFVVAEDKRISQEFLVPPHELGGAKAGQVVSVDLIEQPQRHSQPVARVIEVLGDYGDPGMEIQIALRKHSLPHVFPLDVEKLAAKYAPTVSARDIKGRLDLRDLPLVTIDGETAGRE